MSRRQALSQATADPGSAPGSTMPGRSGRGVAAPSDAATSTAPGHPGRASLDSLCVLPDCPLLQPDVQRDFKELRKLSGAFSRKLGDFLQSLAPGGRAAWLRTSLAASRELFQPWTLEVLYGISALSPARFSTLEQTLGVPAKTLSQRLKTLVGMGLAQRQVFDETPVRIEYTLSKDGRATAALASPLFTHLNMVAQRASG